MSSEEFDETEEITEKRYPVIKVDGHFCQLTNNLKFDCSTLPKGLYCYDICKSEKTEGPIFMVEADVPDLYRWGSLFCREALPIDEDGSYCLQHVSALLMKEPPTVEEFQHMADADLAAVKDCGRLYLSRNMGLIPVYPVLDIYKEFNNIYFGLYYYDEVEQTMDFYGSITVNIDPLPYLCSAIDTNNNGDRMVDFLEQEGFGKKSGPMISSGFCQYPVFRFDDKALHAVDPEVFGDYVKMRGQVFKPDAPERLDNKILAAENRTSGQFIQPNSKEPTRE